jgi:hypothetical protein
MKKFKILPVILMTGLLGSCGLSSSSIAAASSNISENTQAKDAFVYETASSASAIDSLDSLIASSSSSSASTSSSQTSATEETFSEDALKSYLSTVETGLASKTLLTYDDTEASDLTDYTNMITISFTDISGTAESMKLYYIIVKTSDSSSGTDTTSATKTTSSSSSVSADSSESSISSDAATYLNRNINNDNESGHSDSNQGQGNHNGNHGHGNFDDFWPHIQGDNLDKGDVVKSSLEGILVFNDATYNIVGNNVTTADGTSEANFLLGINSSSYIRVRQKTTDSENTFKYTIVASGELIEDYGLTITTDDNGNTRVILKDATIDSRLSVSFHFVTLSGITYIHAIVKESGEHARNYFYRKDVDATTGETTYTDITDEDYVAALLGQSSGSTDMAASSSVA